MAALMPCPTASKRANENVLSLSAKSHASPACFVAGSTRAATSSPGSSWMVGARTLHWIAASSVSSGAPRVPSSRSYRRRAPTMAAPSATFRPRACSSSDSTSADVRSVHAEDTDGLAPLRDGEPDDWLTGPFDGGVSFRYHLARHAPSHVETVVGWRRRRTGRQRPERVLAIIDDVQPGAPNGEVVGEDVEHGVDEVIRCGPVEAFQERGPSERAAMNPRHGIRRTPAGAA